ncbi:hypothetical protein IQ215_13095 [Cyanobacterium stanieri LEGE 03274]|uniref:Uncharacterized protein n=1 Tax=Cyanobacterium stanieri LEGE 03274 TaxID=1828756 RepID=A0ABR9V6X1_9CHRO|nr:hypothetical protein [Cyanobacterium stanieri]MBE9223633.1 hypothetical protein [Cyanobacterium stanieri LEGE 03274]
MDEIPTALRDTNSNAKGHKKNFRGDRPYLQKYIIWFICGLVLIIITSWVMTGTNNQTNNQTVVVEEIENQNHKKIIPNEVKMT